MLNLLPSAPDPAALNSSGCGWLLNSSDGVLCLEVRLLLFTPQLAMAPAANRSWLAPVRKLLLLKGLLVGLVLLLYRVPKPGLPATAVVTVKGEAFAVANRLCAGVAGEDAALRRLGLLKASRGAEEGRARFAASFSVSATSCALSQASMLDS
jgi:hypothetical protein